MKQDTALIRSTNPPDISFRIDICLGLLRAGWISWRMFYAGLPVNWLPEQANSTSKTGSLCLMQNIMLRWLLTTVPNFPVRGTAKRIFVLDFSAKVVPVRVNFKITLIEKCYHLQFCYIIHVRNNCYQVTNSWAQSNSWSHDTPLRSRISAIVMIISVKLSEIESAPFQRDTVLCWTDSVVFPKCLRLHRQQGGWQLLQNSACT